MIPAARENWQYPGPRADGSDPLDVIYSASEPAASVIVRPLLPNANAKRFPEPQLPERPRLRPPSRKHPLVGGGKLEERSKPEEMIITFAETGPTPRFPHPPIDPNDRASAEAFEQQTLKLIAELTKKQEEDHYARFRSKWESQGVTILSSYWLTPALLVKVSPALVDAILQDPQIHYIQPRLAHEHPPTAADARSEVDEGRLRINTDPYFHLGLTDCSIALLDTGVNTALGVLQSRIGTRYNCVEGDEFCVISDDTSPLLDDLGTHGTTVAAIISGNSSQDNDFRGVTAMPIDSYRVYRGGVGEPELDSDAAQRAFQNAVRSGARIIVAEMQGSGEDFDKVVAAADAAFDAGAIVVAANGNLRQSGLGVAAPAKAHKALGIGAYHFSPDYTSPSQSLGPGPGNRIKPDLQGPTDTFAAASGPTGVLQLGGTSGATPYAAGAAALLRNWLLRQQPPTSDPGQVYAMLILSGDMCDDIGDEEGAGRFALPSDGQWLWGKVEIDRTAPKTIPISVTAGELGGVAPGALDAAIWWPESVYRHFDTDVEVHSRVHLLLLDPNGNRAETCVSNTGTGVFERARADNAGATPGEWTLQMDAPSMPAGASQIVYWAAYLHPAIGLKTTPIDSREVKPMPENDPAAKIDPVNQDLDWPEDTPAWVMTLINKGPGQGASGEPAEAIMLAGYPAASPRNGYYRLYVDPELTRFLEYPKSGYLHHQLMAEEGGTLKQASYVWVRRGTEITDETGAVNQSYRAKFLEGRIARDVWKSPWYQTPEDSSGQGGAGATPGTAPAAANYNYGYPPPGGQQFGYGPPPTAYCGYGYGPPPSAYCGYGYTAACGAPGGYGGWPQGYPPGPQPGYGGWQPGYGGGTPGYGGGGPNPWGGPSMHPGCPPTSGCASPVGCHG